MYYLNTKDSLFYPFVVDKENPESKNILALYKDSKNNFWVGSRAGLYKYNYQTNSFIRYAHKDHIISKLPVNTIYDIFEDKNGILWIGTTSGIAYANLNAKKFIHYEVL